MKKHLMLLGLLQATFALSEDAALCSDLGKNLWQPRPFSSYASREIMMLQTLYDNYFKHDDWHGTFATSFEYQQNFGNTCGEKSLGAMPFWSKSNSMTIGNNGSRDAVGYNTTATMAAGDTIEALSADVDAYQFGLGNTATLGEISITPKVQHVGTDFLLHFTKDKHSKGFFFKMKAPLVAMIVDPQMKEMPATLADTVDRQWISYPSPVNRYKNLSEAFAAGSAEIDESFDVTTVAASAAGSATVQSVLHKPLSLEKGRILKCKTTSIRMADLALSLGYNVIGNDTSHLGFGLKGTCPTGTLPQGKYVFEPVVGRAGHWGLGVDVNGHHKYWINEDQARCVDLWMQSEILHLFAGRTPNYRSFDLKQNGPGSKYMLVQFYFPSNPPTNPKNASDNGRVPSFITQAVNITTLPIKSSYSIEGNFATVIEYSKKNWSGGVGLEFWGRSNETIKLDSCSMVKENTANLNDFAILGRQVSENSAPNSIQELYYCEPLARINKSEPRRLEYNALTTSGNYTDKIKDARLTENRIPASLTEALDFASASEKRALSGKVSFHAGYTWKSCKYSPNITMLGGVEIAEYGYTRVNMWSIGLQGSLNF